MDECQNPTCRKATDNPFTDFCSPECGTAVQGYELTEMDLGDLFAGLTAEDMEV